MSFNVRCVISWATGTPNAQVLNDAYQAVGSALTSGYSLANGILMWSVSVTDGTSGYVSFYPSGSPNSPTAIVTFPAVADVRQLQGLNAIAGVPNQRNITVNP